MSVLQHLLTPVLKAGLDLAGRVKRPSYCGQIRLPGLPSQVEVIRDRWGVPHIYGRGLPEVLYAQGFVQAQDRLWQMDYQRRIVAGRLSEILGPPALPADRYLRILGMRRVAEAEFGLIDGQLCAELEAFAAGVNACIQHQPLPVEFMLLRYEPEPWTPVDSLSWAKMISWGLSVNWETELLRAALIDRLGPELAAELEPPPPDRWPVVTPSNPAQQPTRPLQGPPVSARGIASRDAAPRDREDLPPAQGEAEPAFPRMGDSPGSNNWVVSGAKTTSGEPLLANDMHLPLTAPSIWYENHLSASEARLDVTGVSFPGIPYVVAGHNGKVAWGFTNGFPDVQDLFIERLRRTPGGLEYEYRGEWLPAEVRTEVIYVKGAAPAMQEVIATRHGPIINELAPGLASQPAVNGLPETPLALRWTSLDPDTMVDAVRALDFAGSCGEVREALRGWASPIQNVVYADTTGDIGYSYPGRVPIRAKGDGRVPVPGWTGEYEWDGWVPFEELPHQANPPAGYIVSANNRPVDAGYGRFLGAEFCLGDRAQRIVELLTSGKQLNPDFFRAMQFDQYAPSLHLVARQLGRLQVGDPELGPLVALLSNWDGLLTANSVPGAVCEVTLRLLGWVIFQARLGPSGEADPLKLAERLMGAGPTPFLHEGTFFVHRTMEWALNLLGQEESHWYDLGQGEGRTDVLQRILRGTLDYLAKRLGPANPPDYAGWEWGRIHTVTFGHMLGAAPALTGYFSRGTYPLGGDGETVWATGGGVMPADATKVVGPPFRFIADLSDLGKSLGLLAPGNSGRPDSQHYDDQVTAWFEGRYHPMLYVRADVERESRQRLILTGNEE